MLFVFDCEFKKLYKENLKKKRRNFKVLNASNYDTFSSDYFPQNEYKTEESINPYRVFNSYFKKIIKGKYNTTLSFKKSIFDREDKSKLIRKKDIADNLHKKFIKNSHLNNNFILNAKLSMFQNDLIGHKLKDSFESDTIDDMEETSENLRYKDGSFPIKIVRGVLNNHNVDTLSTESTLSKNIMLSYTVDTSNIGEKVSQVEQF